MKKILFFLGALFVLSTAKALKLPSYLNSNMVLQRNSETRFWGWGDPGEEVVVTADWLGSPVSATCGPDGKWQVRLLTGNAGGPYEIRIKGANDKLTLNNILLGEVWVCSGQSNMEFTINMFGGWDKTYPGQKKKFAEKDFRQIRLFTVKGDTSSVYREDCTGKWSVADTATVAAFSATAWFFGQNLFDALGVPVGLVVTAWSGTSAEPWTPKHIIDTDPQLEYYRSDPNRNDWFPTYPGLLFNAMIYPLLKMNIRGAIWYQGESNVTDAANYEHLFPAMVSGWRKAWGLGNFPFYYAQIAPFTYEQAVTGALLRDAQRKCLAIPNSGMAVTMDIAGDVTDIHPKNKPEVGRRLALWALSGTYGIENIVPSGPILKDYRVEEKAIRLTFDYSGSKLLLNAPNNATGFMIAGDDHHFYPARVTIDGNSLLVKSDRVRSPVSVRYAFTNTAEATLFNEEGLPASSFRTDSWVVVTDNVRLMTDYDPASKRILYQLTCKNAAATLHYTTDGSEPGCYSLEYAEPGITMMIPGRLTGRACVSGIASESIGSWEVIRHKGMAANVSYERPYARQYSAGGLYGLVDGIQGSQVFNDGAWQGFEGDDFSVTIDLGEAILIRKVTLHFLSDTNAWIFLPKHVEIKTSANGLHYDHGIRFDNEASLSKLTPKQGKEIATLRASLVKKARYLRINAKNIGVCPPGHPGEGGKAWLFIDEIIVD